MTALPRRRSSAGGADVAVLVIDARRCEEMGLSCCASCTATLLSKGKKFTIAVGLWTSLLTMRLIVNYNQGKYCAVPLVPERRRKV